MHLRANPSTTGITLLNGRIVSNRKAVIPLDDWALRYGWGLFETARLHRGCPMFIDRHLDRMVRAAVFMELGTDYDGGLRRWRRDVLKALAASDLTEGVINCYWTRGSALSGVKPSRVVKLRPRPRHPTGPLRLWVAPWRIEPTYPGAGAKTLAYFPYIFAGLMARREGFDEALVLNTSNRIADGAASSIFVVRDGLVMTPNLLEGTLPGITRGIVLELCGTMGIAVRESRVTWNSLTSAEEVFLTSSLRGVVSVAEVGQHWKQRPRKYPVAERIRDAYRRHASLHLSSWRRAPYGNRLR